MKDIDKLVKPADRKNIKQFNTFPEKKREQFLTLLSETNNVTKSAKTVGVTYQFIQKLVKHDPIFAEQFDEALEIATDNLEEALYNRGLHGTEKGIYFQGEKIDTVREFSDTAAIFLLKGLRPERYRDKSSVEITGKDGGPVELSEVKSKLLSMMGEKVINGESEEVED